MAFMGALSADLPNLAQNVMDKLKSSIYDCYVKLADFKSEKLHPVRRYATKVETQVCMTLEIFHKF